MSKPNSNTDFIDLDIDTVSNLDEATSMNGAGPSPLEAQCEQA